MCDTICMILYMAGRILENWGVWYNMYDTIYTTQLCHLCANWNIYHLTDVINNQTALGKTYSKNK